MHMKTVSFVPASSLPQHDELMDCDIGITFGDAQHSLYSKTDMLKELARHVDVDFAVMKAAIEALPADVYIDMEN